MTRPSSLRGFSPPAEPLEARIAPATILVGAPTSSGVNDVNYTDTDALEDARFVNTEASAADPISGKVGAGIVGQVDTFYLRLQAGDVVKLYNNTNSFEDFIVVKSGNVVAFFIDKRAVDPFSNTVVRDNEIQANELVGLALGKGVSVEVKGSVFGDIATNLDELGTPDRTTDTIQMDGLVSSKQNVATLTIGANVSGGIYSGGAITNVEIKGNVKEILAGSAASAKSFDFFPRYTYQNELGTDVSENVPGGNGIFGVVPVAGEAGPSITKVRVDAVLNNIQAGDGGAGAVGGSLANIQILQDTDGFTLRAGNGGAGGGTKANGGAGGNISVVHVSGVIDATLNSPNFEIDPVTLLPYTAGVRILSGDGGDALPTGNGGAAGKMSSTFVGYEIAAGKTIGSADLLADAVEVRSGTGGDGKTGGAGGAMTDIRVSVVTADANGAEIAVTAGAGGGATTGKAGVGGSITKSDLRNVRVALDADVVITAGNGGTVTGAGAGSVGGAITTASLLGSEIKVLAGNGSTGKTGGAGGSVTGITALLKDDIVTNKLQVNAGTGGNGSDGNAGNGGNVTSLRVQEGDFTTDFGIQINSGAAGNGGAATLGAKGGKGGAGGKVTLVDIIDRDKGQFFEGKLTLRSGSGGDGKTGGGVGGLIDKVSYFGDNLDVALISGNGGAATATGTGGVGGLISNINLAADGVRQTFAVDASVVAGNGGAGQAAKSNGGAGGELKAVQVNTDGDVTLRAGNGGDGGSAAAPGKGGSVLNSAGFATGGFLIVAQQQVLANGILAAGNAGAAGAKAALGGSIIGTLAQPASLRAFNNIDITAGNGSHGGAGGSIKFVTFGSTADSLRPTPSGNILVQAGNGSAEGAIAGAGGSIDSVQGNPSSNLLTIRATDGSLSNIQNLPLGTTTRIIAGAGGGSVTATKSGNGGLINNVAISGVSEDGVIDNNTVITVEAGHAGRSPLAKTGANGGGVKGVGVGGLDSQALFRSVAAGDGSEGTTKGGNGGSLDGVYINKHDLGVRSGTMYGYATMGGVFAGAAGVGTGAGAKAGLAGSVKNIVAEAIAAIVAGRGAAPQLAEKVERITVTGTSGLAPEENPLLKIEDGDLINPEAGGDPNFAAFDLARFATAALVGAVFDPGAVDGNQFKFTPVGAAHIGFQPGDLPIDGLIAAKVFVNGAPTNFVPEALLTTAGFFDHDNRFSVRLP